ncbi:MAG: AMP-dependent synthetase [Gemmatimonadetes bacterium]|nr:AMP-dependent synthetase [Gemmatimonadota bacterium]
MTTASTVRTLLDTGHAGATALSAPGGVPLTYGALRALVAETVAALGSRGIGQNDRVAIVLDNGPEMAAAFLAVASGAAAAPLNPSYRADEFEFYLTDLKAKVLLVAKGKELPAVAVAERLGIPVARLVPHPERGAGTFTLELPESLGLGGAAQPRAITPEDIALVLHTSGTTSRPKIVPLAHGNVCASARNIRGTLALTAKDRGLVIMPLFHIHGLIAALLTPLSVGGEVCCTPGFNALKFFGWMGEVHPTWYTGVPTMHQAILMRAAKNADVIKANPLRFIRSSSSSLPTTVIGELEAVFGSPVIESYGMTEASHQMTSSPLPPGARKPGSVGPAAGPEVRVVDADGTTVPVGGTGEIVIRGENVMGGYENNPEANATAFINGWFRTGDQGVMDAEGYLTITGRLKEIINRGGEKISPREVDEILMEHPAVRQCVTFSVPHAMLGEEVAAAVVLREGHQASDKELRQFAAVRLADFKVPRQILFVAEIPVGATGKLQRIGLAQKLGLA